MKNPHSPSASAADTATVTATELAPAAGSEKPVMNATESRALADQAALDFSGASTRDLLPEEADAWASFVSAVEVSQAIAAKRDIVVVDVRAAEDFAGSANGRAAGGEEDAGVEEKVHSPSRKRRMSASSSAIQAAVCSREN